MCVHTQIYIYHYVRPSEFVILLQGQVCNHVIQLGSAPSHWWSYPPSSFEHMVVGLKPTTFRTWTFCRYLKTKRYLWYYFLFKIIENLQESLKLILCHHHVMKMCDGLFKKSKEFKVNVYQKFPNAQKMNLHKLW